MVRGDEYNQLVNNNRRRVKEGKINVFIPSLAPLALEVLLIPNQPLIVHNKQTFNWLF